jgi:cytosine/adenosine deaminase-related metal-dependent hydrolase
VVFSHTTVVNADAVQHDVALAVQGDRIAAIGETDAILPKYPGAAVYDGRGKALLPGLINCHAHLGATIERGFNEDFGFPNSYRLATRPDSLLSAEEATLMAVMGALESIRGGTTTVVEFTGGIASSAAALADTGLRWVFAESIRDIENGAGPVSAESLARSEAPRFSQELRDEGWQIANDLFEAWHGKRDGRIRVFPTTALAEDSSPELLRSVREFAEKHDLGYTIHLAQTTWEVEYMQRHHGLRPTEFLARHDFLGPRLFAAHCRYVDDSEIALLGRSGTIVTQQAHMAANRGVIPPIPALRAAGCPIAQGTDNNTNDMLETMRIALVTERIRRNDATPGRQPQPEDMLADAAQGGARAVRQETLLGSLEAGKKADILVLDARRTHLVPAGRILSAWINNGQPSDVESVMVDGRFVMRDRKILTVDEPSLIAEADKVGRRVWNQVEAASPVRVPRLPRS